MNVSPRSAAAVTAVRAPRKHHAAEDPCFVGQSHMLQHCQRVPSFDGGPTPVDEAADRGGRLFAHLNERFEFFLKR